MAQIWEPNEDLGPEEELATTDHRDRPSALVEPEDEEAVETTADDPQAALAELGEDAASSPARRGHDDQDEQE